MQACLEGNFYMKSIPRDYCYFSDLSFNRCSWPMSSLLVYLFSN